MLRSVRDLSDMTKPAAFFVAAAMAVTAACVGVIAAYGLGLGIGSAALAALAALGAMAVVHLAFIRTPAPPDGRLDDLDRVATELQSRLETVELRLATLDGAAGERARAVVKPVVEELAALGALVTSVAKEVAAQDAKIAHLAATRSLEQANASLPPAPPASAPPSPAPAAPIHPPHAPRPQPFTPPVIPLEPRQTRAPDLEPFDPDEPEILRPPSPRAAAPDLGLLARLELALRDDRVDVHLQPIVSLPSRRILHYEALSRLIENEAVTEAAGFMDVAAAAGRTAEIDRRAVERAAGVALRLAASGRSGSVFVNIAPGTLADEAAVAAIRATLERQSECARLIVLELRQTELAQLDPVERAALDAFRERGVRLSMDRAADLRLEPRELAQAGVRFVKVAADRLLDPDAVRGASIHPADLAGLLARHGIDLVATHVEEERTVPELLDMDVKAAQGLLFGAARPVRPPAEKEGAAASGAAALRLVPRNAAAS